MTRHRPTGRIYLPAVFGTPRPEQRVPMPCHPRHAEAVLQEFDRFGARQCWEQARSTCGLLYRFQSRNGIRRHIGQRLVWWQPIERLTDPDHPQREPLDCWLVEVQRFSAA